MIEVTLPSGTKLQITLSEFDHAMALHDAILKCAKEMPVVADIAAADISVLKDAVIAAAVSPEVKVTLFRCFERVLYGGIKLTKDLFDDPKLCEKARGDYYFICWEVVKANCGPFFVSLFSKFKTALATPPESHG